MIPTQGCDPKINVMFIGSVILNKLKLSPLSIDDVIQSTTTRLSISVDHVLLTIDWLYMIKAINFFDDKLKINEINKFNDQDK